jgi:hypothetical protein
MTFTDSSGMSLIWAILELDMAIICGCLLLLKPLIQICIKRMRKGISRLSSGSRSLDSKGVSKSSLRGSRESNGFEVGQIEILALPTAARVRQGPNHNANDGTVWSMAEDIPGYDSFLYFDRRSRQQTVV